MLSTTNICAIGWPLPSVNVEYCDSGLSTLLWFLTLTLTPSVELVSKALSSASSDWRSAKGVGGVETVDDVPGKYTPSWEKNMRLSLVTFALLVPKSHFIITFLANTGWHAILLKKCIKIYFWKTEMWELAMGSIQSCSEYRGLLQLHYSVLLRSGVKFRYSKVII